MTAPVKQDLIHEWLASMDLDYEPVDLDTDSGYTWGLRTAAKPFGVVVAQREGDWPHIFLQVSVNVSPQHLDVLESMDERARALFVADLNLALFQQPVGFVLAFNEGDPTIPREMTFGLNMLEDDPQRAGFFRRHHQIVTAAQLAVTMFKKLEILGGWS